MIDVKKEILRLRPAWTDYLWGGTMLWNEYEKKIDLTLLTETWECSGPSIAGNGQYGGGTLSEVLKLHPKYLGTTVKNSETPIFVKFIDAKIDLFIQVYQDDGYSRSMSIKIARPKCGMSFMLIMMSA